MAFGPLTTVRFLLQHPLTREQPWTSMVRYARWQLASRIAPGPVAVDFVNDARLLVRPGMTGATGNVYAGLHEYEDMAFVLHALQPGDWFTDVGANVGSYTVLAAKAVGARVIAFEPVATTFRHLQDNIALNSIGARVDARQACVGSVAGSVAMTTDEDTVNHVVVNGERGTSAMVPLVRLDDALEGRVPFMIKLDVEGYELEVLRGAQLTLASAGLQCLIMEINGSGARYGREDAELLSIMAAHGFSRLAYAPRERQLREPAEASGANAIFVRDRALVQRRLDGALRFRVLQREL
jgi:FkbM family methyltransferase